MNLLTDKATAEPKRIPNRKNIFGKWVLDEGWTDRGESSLGAYNAKKFHLGCDNMFRVAYRHNERIVYCPDCFYIAKHD